MTTPQDCQSSEMMLTLVPPTRRDAGSGGSEWVMGETGIDGTHFCPRSTYGQPATATATSEHLPAAVKRIGCL